MINCNMEYCIKCGSKLVEIYDREELTHIITNYQCLNANCSEFKKPWLFAENKDSQNWAVRHIRLLEKEVAELKARLDELESKPNENV
jgi:hypothetical protein